MHEILGEREMTGGWEYLVQVIEDDGGLRQFRLTLSWADYNLWTRDGSNEPVAVARAVITFLLTRFGLDDLGPKLDASIARRLDPEADARIPRLIGR